MMRRRRTRWLWWLLFLGVITVGVAYGPMLGQWALEKLPDPSPMYRYAAVKRGKLSQVVTTSGQLTPVVKVEVGSPISGTLKNVFVDCDQRVSAGHILAQIDPATFEADLAQAQGGLSSALAALELARVNVHRAEAQHTEGLISESDYDKVHADLKQAESAVEISRAG